MVRTHILLLIFMTVFLGCTKRKTDTEIKLSEVFTEVTGKPLPQRGIVFIYQWQGAVPVLNIL